MPLFGRIILNIAVVGINFLRGHFIEGRHIDMLLGGCIQEPPGLRILQTKCVSIIDQHTIDQFDPCLIIDPSHRFIIIIRVGLLHGASVHLIGVLK
jgi:hypothetical protein